jgi:hypothetical protein
VIYLVTGVAVIWWTRTADHTGTAEQRGLP